MRKKRVLIVVLLVTATVVWAAVRWANSCSRPAHANGVAHKQLAGCPDRPNCISTRAERPEQSIAPFLVEDAPKDALATLETIIESMPRSQIVSSREHYLHAEFRSRIFGFVDDVEFLIDESEGAIHFRAAARVGHSDLGVNRSRMEKIREQYEAVSR